MIILYKVKKIDILLTVYGYHYEYSSVVDVWYVLYNAFTSTTTLYVPSAKFIGLQTIEFSLSPRIEASSGCGPLIFCQNCVPFVTLLNVLLNTQKISNKELKR